MRQCDTVSSRRSSQVAIGLSSVLTVDFLFLLLQLSVLLLRLTWREKKTAKKHQLIKE